MESNLKSIIINSFNCRGLRNSTKRKSIFNWLKNNFLGLTLLQETHSCISDERMWQSEWGGEIKFSHGDYNARGTAILIPKNLGLNLEIENTETDGEGRFIIMNCKIENTSISLFNIYSPTKDNSKLQLKFLEFLHKTLEKNSSTNIVLGGDLNTYLNINLDKKGGKSELKESLYCQKLKYIMEEYTLCDIWRVRNPHSLKFTRVERGRGGIVQSRLDYFLVSIGLTYLIRKVDILPGLSSDHSIVTLTVDIQDTNIRGKGYWKFNNDLLLDNEYVNKIKNTINSIKQNITMSNKNTLWEYVKCQIRTDTLQYASYRAKKIKSREIELIKKLKALETQLNNEQKYLEYIQVKGEWESMEQRKTNGIIMRSKAQWVEQGEKNTKYFLNLEKRNYNNTYIKKLIKDNNIEISEISEIIKEEQTFYKSLYSSKTKVKNKQNLITYLSNTKLPTLTCEEKTMCESNLSLEEIEKALMSLPNNKSPGADGLTTNFFKFFWVDIGSILLESYNYSFTNNNLTQYQKRAILNLLPKKDKDIRYLKNWRPVSLLTTDYKILTKALALRLQKVISNLANSDQVGYIKNRYIGENIRTIFDLLNFTKINNIEAYIAQIDFEKAFDSIEWPFMLKTLEKFNFGENFIKWIKILYTDIYACVGNNGYYSDYFSISRSIRQGCPISALLFVFVLEVLATNIRLDKNIVGIKLKNVEYKLSLMADDMTLFISDLESLNNSVMALETFESFSGLKLNLGKTELIPLGKPRNINTIKLSEKLEKISVKQAPFKALGVWFSNNIKEINYLNFNDRLQKMDELINIWKCRGLSLKGKITIIKTLILPQIQFLFSMIYVPYNVQRQIDDKLFKYLWDDKPPKIKRSTIIASIENGGLGMVDIYVTQQVAKCLWIKRLTDERNGKWKEIFWYMLSIKQELVNKNLSIGVASNSKSEFHAQLLESWFAVSAGEPINIKNILNQYILYNQYILINKIPLTAKDLNIERIDIKIINIVDNNGKFLGCKDFNNKFECNISHLLHRSIISAIPRRWKTAMKIIYPIQNGEKLLFQSEILTNIVKNPKTMEKTVSKDIYKAIVSKKSKKPTSLDKWINAYPFLEGIDWGKVFLTGYSCNLEPYLQSFQYKIINRLLNCNENLYKWKIKNSDKCFYCPEIDTIEHHLFECSKSKKLWQELKSWMLSNLEFSFDLTICEVLFGIPTINNNNTKLFNFLIIITKYYINRTKTSEGTLYLIELLLIIREKIKMIDYINESLGRDSRGWHEDLLDIL